ncbi:hypothetical protein BX666DRAFT_2026815 [Dichotomocladium elegans]|nr:hypothetical protein BX666DRAFT_2026815 [Dichotomocladium elegans]
MLPASSLALQSVLAKLYESPEKYVADVCFEYPSQKIWAHRGNADRNGKSLFDMLILSAPIAIILARAPSTFSQKYLEKLMRDASAHRPKITVFRKPILPPQIMQQLLRFWYTGEFAINTLATDSASMRLSALSMTSTQSTLSSSIATANEIEKTEIFKEIQEHEKLLATPLMTYSSSPSSTQQQHEYQQDLVEQLVTDIKRMYDQGLGADVVFHFGGSESKPLAAHRCILAAQSSHFYQLFCSATTNFSPTVDMLAHDPAGFSILLDYYYTQQLMAPPSLGTGTNQQQQQHHHNQLTLNAKKQRLRLLQACFRICDIFNEDEKICTVILEDMAAVLNHYRCLCNDCVSLLPFMLWFADQFRLRSLRKQLMTLYTDPFAPSLWSAPAFSALAEQVPSLLNELESRVAIKKQTVTQLLEALHLTLTRLRPQTISIRLVLTRLINQATSVVADNFDYYCSEYPILLSYLDGIGTAGGDGKADFLEFLLMRVVTQGIHDRNATIIYHGIVGDLVSRIGDPNHTVVLNARQKCVVYLAKRWQQVKAQGSFKTMDKDMLRKLSEDIDVPYRTLTKSFDTSFRYLLFGFCANNSNTNNGTKDDNSSNAAVSGVATALSVNEKTPTITRQGSLSSTTGISGVGTIGSARTNKELKLLLDSLLPLETGNSATSTSPLTGDNTTSSNATTATATGKPQTTSRPSRLRWELPSVPQRESRIQAAQQETPHLRNHYVHQQKNQYQHQKKQDKQYPTSRSPFRWLQGAHKNEQHVLVPTIGAKVELLRRPLPMYGVIKYIGEVHFAKGTYVGVELESRLGSNDGSIDGNRYFQTDHQRGAFCKLDDFKIISLPTSA